MEQQITKSDDEDLISALPQPIVHHILSFLPTKDVKVTSSLSKAWYQTLTSFPYIDLDIHQLLYRYYNRFTWEECLDKYLNYVDETLHSFHDHNNDLNLQIQRFTLPINFTPKATPFLDRWITLIFRRPVQEFNLKIRNGVYDRPCYDLPQAVLAAKSIKVANLQGCSLLQSLCPLSGGSSSSKLVKLILYNVLLDDVILSSIISSCGLIEELSISSCIGVKRLRISNLKKLKTLEISQECDQEERTEIVEIDAPRLEKLDILGPLDMRGAIECSRLTDLRLDSVVLEDSRLEDLLPRLSFIRSLSLENLFSLTKVKISSNTLNKLMVFGCHNLVELKIDAPNMIYFRYNGEFELHYDLSMHKLRCEWFADCICYNNGLADPFTVEDNLVVLRNIVSKAKHKEYLCLYFRHIKPFNFVELNKRVIKPVVDINHLDLFVINRASLKINSPDLLDVVLWICHPRILSLHFDHDHLWNESKKSFLKDIREVIMCHLACSHSLCKHARSWLHCLEDVTYVTKNGDEARLAVDGISEADLCDSGGEIKFMFKWPRPCHHSY